MVVRRFFVHFYCLVLASNTYLQFVEPSREYEAMNNNAKGKSVKKLGLDCICGGESMYDTARLCVVRFGSLNNLSFLFSTHSEPLPKRSVSEEIVASHLQQLNLTSNLSNTSPIPPVNSANTTCSVATTTQGLPPSQNLTWSSSSPLSSVPLLTSLDVLATAARSCPLSIKTVASCPRSLETNKDKDEMVCDDEQICTDNANDPLGRSVQSSSSFNYSTVVTSAQLTHSPDPSSLVSRQSQSLLHSLDKSDDETDGGVYQSMRTSPGHHHKRPACVLDEEDGEIENAEGPEEVCSIGPYTKRSKVDLRYV